MKRNVQQKDKHKKTTVRFIRLLRHPASGLEMEWAYSGFGASQICHLLTYLDIYPLTVLTASGCTRCQISVISEGQMTVYSIDKITCNETGTFGEMILELYQQHLPTQPTLWKSRSWNDLPQQLMTKPTLLLHKRLQETMDVANKTFECLTKIC